MSAKTSVCCRDAGYLSCEPADIKPAILGRRKIVLPPTNEKLDFVGNIAGNNDSYYYRGEAGSGAYAAITCRQQLGGGKKSDIGCNGQAVDSAGSAFVLEYCGLEGHVWKVPDMDAFQDHAPGEEGIAHLHIFSKVFLSQ